MPQCFGKKIDSNLVKYLAIHEFLMMMDDDMGIVPFYMEKLFMTPKIRMTVKN